MTKSRNCAGHVNASLAGHLHGVVWFAVFGGYRFEHPRTEATVDVGGWAYLWAGLFGAFYVWRKGFPQLFLKAFAYNVAFALGCIAVWGATSIPQVPVRFQGLILLAMVPVVILVQANLMISMIRDGYRRRGWMIRPG